jgi:hypothetical protein
MDVYTKGAYFLCGWGIWNERDLRGCSFWCPGCSPCSSAGVNDLMECVAWTYTRRVLVFYVGREFEMSGSPGVLVLCVGGGLSCAGSPGVFVLYVGGELEMSGISGGARFVRGCGT